LLNYAIICLADKQTKIQPISQKYQQNTAFPGKKEQTITMIKVLFICHGNICRSPMAEFILKDMVSTRGIADRFYIESAATSYEEIGNPVYPPARAELAKHGISCKGKQACKLLKRDFEEFDYLIAMEGFNLRNIKREFGAALTDEVKLLLDYTDTPGDIDDPWYTGSFDVTYGEIVAGCQGFLQYLEENNEI